VGGGAVIRYCDMGASLSLTKMIKNRLLIGGCMRKINKVDRIFLTGGLIGLLFTNPRRAIDSRVEEANKHGWNLHQILPHVETNWLIWIFSIIVLFLTLGLFTFGAGYILLFEKEVKEVNDGGQ